MAYPQEVLDLLMQHQLVLAHKAELSPTEKAVLRAVGNVISVELAKKSKLSSTSVYVAFVQSELTQEEAAEALTRAGLEKRGRVHG